ncbi:1-pyrroline-5-carboxylate dehydrogenase [Vibrio agarivorans]|uniref:1-pyrroline-5-carboxylate dehydrogenase n=1 Tax=Vibrio agarivorans TaxID=153622 RepID=UPI0025B33904|nr:1-pyrroline-5-carboxylate dehydrogenase [Vibrio agarivorans]MDN3660880.1 1-pyrroline-5-carboxylate dehydrogenase [Vibrio agarivorans]
MIQHITQFKEASLALEYWRFVDSQQRSEYLLTFQSQLAQKQPALAAIMAMQIAASRELIDKTTPLCGPTGETNELYLSARGVTLLVLQEECLQARMALLAQLIAALSAGNSVVLCSVDHEFSQLIEQSWAATQASAHLVQCFSLESYQEFVELDIRTAGYVGSEGGVKAFNRHIAQREGVIVPVVVETDLTMLPTAQDPMLALRFSTERTRTINITAVGGNATLLELGNPTH